jgi:pyruvate formate lyase activating enzyme
MAGREVTVRQVMDEIEKDRAFFDESGGGVTFSGGEPLSQPDFLLTMLEACRERRIHTVVDTSGFSPWGVLDRIRWYVDLFLFDLKLMDDDRHRQFTGVSNRRILENLRALSAGGHPLRIRIPIIPGVTDDDDNLAAIGDFVAGLPSTPQIDMLSYHHLAAAKYERLGRDYHFKNIEHPSADTLYRRAELLRCKGLTVHIERS